MNKLKEILHNNSEHLNDYVLFNTLQILRLETEGTNEELKSAVTRYLTDYGMDYDHMIYNLSNVRKHFRNGKSLDDRITVLSKDSPICPINSFCADIKDNCSVEKKYVDCGKFRQYIEIFPTTFEFMYMKARGIEK